MEDETTPYKEELLQLVAKKKIKHTAKYIENETNETLKKITTNTTPRIGRSERKSHGRAYHEIIRTYGEFGVGER